MEEFEIIKELHEEIKVKQNKKNGLSWIRKAFLQYCCGFGTQ